MTLFETMLLDTAGALLPRPARVASGLDHAPWRTWLATMYPSYVSAGFAPRHERFWEWVWAIRRRRPARPFTGFWPRGGAKSSSVELGVAALGLRGERLYCLYVRDTQDRADDSVQNVATLLESPAVDMHYPEHAERLVGKHGNSKGWRRNRIRTAGGFTVDALGLDVAARGVKLEDKRPDLIVFDDIDSREDSPAATAKKIRTITEGILPAGAQDGSTAVVFIQNLIIAHGVAARLADGRADFLRGRIVSGPEPAVLGLAYTLVPTREDDGTVTLRHRITAGTPTWSGQSLASCEAAMDRYGAPAFLREMQHAVHERDGALWLPEAVAAARVDTVPDGVSIVRAVVAVDPSGGGDDVGIVAGGLGSDGIVYVTRDATVSAAIGPARWAQAAVDAFDDTDADRVVAERNFGGDMVLSTLRTARANLPVAMVTASRGKALRAEPVAALYGTAQAQYADGRVKHLPGLVDLEAEMTGWAPGDAWSPNRLDALVWLVTDLALGAAPLEGAALVGHRTAGDAGWFASVR